ncbi:MAG: DUF4373 domain-containing protein [Ignavibacteriae bacterium]|nr:DUF4373 domain-containing protein [Ignavibacteriota bacterium]
MARNTKQGVDYFPLDCRFDDNIDLYLTEKESNGLAVLITTWQLIYSNDGYFKKFDDDLLLMIKKRIGLSLDEIRSCLMACIKREIFDKNLFEKFNILSSRTIQKIYFSSAKKKKEIIIVNLDYLLFMPENDNLIDSGGNKINVCGNQIDSGGNTTKEEEEEKKKKKENQPNLFPENEVEKIKALFETYTIHSNPYYKTFIEPILELRKKIPEDMTIEQIDEVITSYFVKYGKDKPINMEFFLDNISKEIIKKHEEILNIKKQKLLKEAEKARLTYTEINHEADEIFKKQQLLKQKENFDKNYDKFSEAEKEKFIRLFENGLSMSISLEFPQLQC